VKNRLDAAPKPARTRRVLGLAAAVWVGVLASTLPVGSAHAKGPDAPALPQVALVTLPEQAQQVHALILKGGPFRYAKDGTVFGNRERLLPGKARGFYREYTVPTPGSKDRGARRIVCGGTPPTEPDACYYTADHYASFRLIVR
jgi:ribonuclease T1